MPKLYVAIYRPVEGNYDHWALFLENGSSKTVFQVTGEHPNFAYSERITDPSNSRSHKENILVADINKQDISALQQSVRNANIDNSVAHWNCQDYVLEALDELKEDCIIDDDDDHYAKSRRQLERRYGANV